MIRSSGPATSAGSRLGKIPDVVDVSVVVPVIERPEPLVALYEEYAAPLRESGLSYEFLFLSSGWNAESRAALGALLKRDEPVKFLETGQPFGEGALVRAAGALARGRVLLTLPAYHRVDPATLPALVERVAAGADMVVARRWPRHDSWVNRLQNRVFHSLLAGMTHQRVNDVACGVRAMRPGMLEEIPLYGDFFRFLPLLAVQEGYDVVEIDAPQHPKDISPRVYRPGIYLRRLLDIFGLVFLLRFTDKPLRFFGLVGSGLSLGGAMILLVLLIERLAGAEGIADRPLLLLGVLFFVLGAQAIALGLIGEIIVHVQSQRRPTYRVRVTAGPE